MRLHISLAAVILLSIPGPTAAAQARPPAARPDAGGGNVLPPGLRAWAENRARRPVADYPAFERELADQAGRFAAELGESDYPVDYVLKVAAALARNDRDEYLGLLARSAEQLRLQREAQRREIDRHAAGIPGAELGSASGDARGQDAPGNRRPH